MRKLSVSQVIQLSVEELQLGIGSGIVWKVVKALIVCKSV